jgi:DNA/RNA-binding domain of Phe-tRNA-synthetase-like protein
MNTETREKKFMLDQPFIRLFPDIAIGVMAVGDIRKEGEIPDGEKDEIRSFLAHANEEAKKFLTSQVISENKIPALWRAAYKKFPGKKGARCSIEALLKRVLHGNSVPSIAPTVDITNGISLKYGFPIGAENLDAFCGDLHLGVMKGGEPFLPLGDEGEDAPLAGEVAYYDDCGVVCRCFNWRDGRRTAVTENTVNEFIAMEYIEPERIGELKLAMEELAMLLERHTGARICASGIVTAAKKEMVIFAP